MVFRYLASRHRMAGDDATVMFVAKHVAYPKRLAGLHGDFHIGNLLLTAGGKLAVMDFDRRQVGDRWQDFQRALQEVQPAFGLEKDELSIRFRNGIIEYSEEFKKLYAELMTMVDQVRNSDQTPLMSVCLDGIQGPSERPD